LLRAASGPRIGSGHFARTRAVAQALRELEAPCRLVVEETATLERLLAEGFDAVSTSEDPAWTRREAHAVWLDGNRPWREELEILEGRDAPILLVENRKADRDLAWRVLYPCLHHEPDAWDVLHAQRVLAGAPWIPFARELSGASQAGERDIDLLVTFGGSDPFHSTERVLPLLPEPLLSSGRVLVVIGPYMTPRCGDIEAAAANLPGVELLVGVEDLTPWIARSRVALSAVGTSLYEFALLGVPALVLANYTNDLAALDVYRRRGPHLPLGLQTELDDAELHARLRERYVAASTARRPSVEGLGDGARRIARLLIAAEGGS
jgi:spore coat polysaccharide biosynthesis predicted glycosyltransferase SpsG